VRAKEALSIHPEIICVRC